MIDKQWYSRYSRQLLVDGFDEQHQSLLGEAKVTIAGIGGLGCSAAMQLAACGVGSLSLVDPDVVSNSNLPRQHLFSEADIGEPKVSVARKRLLQNNAQCQIDIYEKCIEDSALTSRLRTTDIILDCTDNSNSRLYISKQARVYDKPVISAAATGLQAHVIAFHWLPGHCCYGCLHALEATPDTSCLRQGILAPVVSVAGLYQALMAIHFLTGLHALPWGTLMQFCATTMTWKHLRLPKAANCSICEA